MLFPQAEMVPVDGVSRCSMRETLGTRQKRCCEIPGGVFPESTLDRVHAGKGKEFQPAWCSG